MHGNPPPYGPQSVSSGGHRFKSCHWLLSQKVPEFWAKFFVFQLDHINTTDRFYFFDHRKGVSFIRGTLFVFCGAGFEEVIIL